MTYVTDIDVSGRTNPLVRGGLQSSITIGHFEKEAYSVTTVTRIGRIPADAIITRADVFCDALTGASNVDLGFYEPVNPITGVGAVVDVDVLVDGADISAGKARTAPLNGLTNVAVGGLGKKVYELLGKTRANMLPEYDLALTFRGATSGTGTVEYCISHARPV